MKERPILFSALMVRAILDGRKTQTRRVVKPQPVGKQTIIEGVARTTIGMNPADDGAVWYVADCVNPGIEIRCKFGRIGDRLWVREAFHTCPEKDKERYCYRADNYETSGTGCGLSSSPKWKPSIHMPRWASRINLEITGIRVERLNDISEADAVAEGADAMHLDDLGQSWKTHKRGFRALWESINGPESWSANPFVWVVEFKKLGIGLKEAGK